MTTLTIGNDVDNEALGNSVEVEVTISGLPATLDSYRFDVTFSRSVLSALTTNPGTCAISIPAPSVTLSDANGNQIPFATKDRKVFVAAPLTT